jgi:hypothetical protein
LWPRSAAYREQGIKWSTSTPVTAIEAPPGLEVDQHGPHGGQYGALAAEQELAQVRGLAKQPRVQRPHVPEPCSVNHVLNQSVELAEAVRDAGPQFDMRAPVGVRVQEVQDLASDVLELPEGHA